MHMDEFHINCFGPWSYPFVVSFFYILFGWMAWKYRCIWRFWNWWSFARITVLTFVVLGFFFEGLADLFHVWEWPDGEYARDVFRVAIPFVHWGVPISEFFWI